MAEPVHLPQWFGLKFVSLKNWIPGPQWIVMMFPVETGPLGIYGESLCVLFMFKIH